MRFVFSVHVRVWAAVKMRRICSRATKSVMQMEMDTKQMRRRGPSLVADV